MKKVKRKRISTEGFGRPVTNIFQGEMMTCAICDKQQQSDPNIESGWTAIQVDGSVNARFCPECWHGISEAIGYGNMSMMATGIAMGSQDLRRLGRQLRGLE